MVIYTHIAYGSGQKKPAPKAATTQPAAARKVLSGAEIFAKYSSHVFTIIAGDKQGTAFLSDLDNVVTCAHTIDAEADAKIRTAKGKTIPLTWLQGLDEVADVAVFRLTIDEQIDADLLTKNLPVAWGMDDLPKVGDPVYVIGCPLGLEQTFTQGVVSGYRTVKEITYMQLSAPISKGSSGSPVIDKYGTVVAMVTGSIEEGQQLNFAVTAGHLRQFGIPYYKVLRGKKATSGSSDSDAKVTAAPSGDSADDLLLRQLKAKRRPALASCRDLNIVVEELPSEASGKFTKKDVASWIEEDLAQYAPGLTIVSSELQGRRFLSSRTKTGHEYLNALDDLCRHLYMGIGYIVLESLGVTVYTVQLRFRRHTLSSVTTEIADVWQTTQYGFFGSAHSASHRLREAVQTAVKEFAQEWAKANKLD
jgi:hypothetical protein